MNAELQLYNSSYLITKEDGSISLNVRNQDEAKEALRYAFGMNDGVHQLQEVSLWTMGDLLVQAEDRFPDIDLSDVVDNTPQNYKTIRRLINVSRKWPRELRRDTSHSVHAEIAQKKGLDVMERMTLIDIAVNAGLNVYRTRQLVSRYSKAEDKEDFVEQVSNSVDVEEFLDGERSNRIRYVRFRMNYSYEMTSVDVLGGENIASLEPLYHKDVVIDMSSRSMIMGGNEMSIPTETPLEIE